MKLALSQRSSDRLVVVVLFVLVVPLAFFAGMYPGLRQAFFGAIWQVRDTVSACRAVWRGEA